MKYFVASGILGAAILSASIASAASLSSMTCHADYIDFAFTGITAETNITMEGQNTGSSAWTLIGGGALDGSSTSVSVGIPTNDSEFAAIIPDVNSASFRATVGSAVSAAFTC